VATLADDSGIWSVDEASLGALARALSGQAASASWFSLRRDAEELALVPGFDRLITLDANTIKELPHQIDVATRVLRRPMAGRAILADEVGLGKTIEAGIILKELAVRGLARRVLILCPASLVEQWQGELKSKFFEEFDAPAEPADWRDTTRAIVSYDRAISEKHRREILRHRWDLVIVDEAHKVKNHQAARYKFLQEVERNYILLLTATPLQNDLRELYNLVTLLRPGQLGTWRDFQKAYVTRGDARKVKNADALRDLTSQVMLRTRRASVADALELPPRKPRHPNVRLTGPEGELYRETSSFLRALYREGFIHPSEEEVEEDRVRRKRRTGKGIFQLELLRLCQRLCSSSRALSDSLNTLADGELIAPEFRSRARELAHRARAIGDHGKLATLDTVLAETPDRIIVFSEHLPTLDLIAEHVRSRGRNPILFSGSLSMSQRGQRLAAFKNDETGVFVATRAGTEGLNLQFCNVLVNYELPWNPMVVEQRIGRIHRIGQTRTAHIVNLAAQGTVEAHVLRLLDQKIKLFELVVGELDVILGDFGGAEKLEETLTDAWLSADSDAAFEEKLETIGEEITQSREAGMEQERVNSELAAEDNAMRLAKEFRHLSVAGRVRLGYGTKHLMLARGVEARRRQLGLHVSEIMEALEHTSPPVDAGVHPDYGPMQAISGLTSRLRAVHLLVQADRLPMMLVDIDTDSEPPLHGTTAA
jgi:SNF2 family DNA or RNA helicase